MSTPIFVRPLEPFERLALEEGLRSSQAFTLRRCQILLASAEGETPPQIATQVRCSSQTVRNVGARLRAHTTLSCAVWIVCANGTQFP